jgi:hypothetical protein
MNTASLNNEPGELEAYDVCPAFAIVRNGGAAGARVTYCLSIETD